MATSPIHNPQEEAAEGGAMDDSELASLLAQHENRSVGYYTSDIADEQAKALDYYYGRPFGDEREGRSQVVDRTVAVTVDNALAALLKPFVSAEDVVSFEPRGPEDEEVAQQATEYVNYCFQCDNPGFTILHHWFKDALLTKVGIVKYWWEDKTKQTVEHQQVDDMGLIEARQHPDYAGEELGDGMHQVALNKTMQDGNVKVVNVPPEEFLISPLSRSLEEAPYIAHRPANMTRSDLIEMGMDAEVVESLSAYAQGKNEESRSQARYEDEEWTNGSRDNPGNDKSRDIIGVLDEYVRVDYDGDGVSELRRVIRVNDTILFNEVVDDHPFALLCPVPMPHKVYGLSLADQTMDLQRIASVVWRQTLDNLYLSNNPRPEIPDSAVNDNTYDDLMDDSPGAAIRVKGPGLDWAVVPFAADKSYPMLGFIGEQVEARTGVRRGGNGLDRNSLNKSTEMTAMQAAQIEAKENERIEMIARIFAETGLSRLFGGILKLVSKYQPKARVIRLRNKWVEIDPRGWPEMDVRVSVGLGVGNRAEQIAQAQSVLETMAELAVSPFAHMVKDENVYNAVKRKYQAAGIKNVDDFIGDPAQDQGEKPAPKPDPEMMKVQAQAQKDQAQLQLDQQKTAAQLQQTQQESALKLQLAREESAAKIQFMREEAQAKIELQREKNQQEAELALRQQDAEFALSQRQMEMQAEADERNAARQHEIAQMSAKRPGGDLDK